MNAKVNRKINRAISDDAYLTALIVWDYLQRTGIPLNEFLRMGEEAMAQDREQKAVVRQAQRIVRKAQDA